MCLRPRSLRPSRVKLGRRWGSPGSGPSERIQAAGSLSARELGLEGARRGKKIHTTVRDDGHQRASDLLNRDFTATRPNQRWVADFTHVMSWAGVVYVAFVVDVFSRTIVGWSAATSKRAKLVLDALDMALWRRDRAGTPAGPGLIHHSDAGSQYTSFAFTARLIEAGLDTSIGTVGDARDNALMPSGGTVPFAADLVCTAWGGGVFGID